MTLPDVECLSAENFEQHIPRLSEILTRCVETGASVNFVLPFTQADAADFWCNKILPVLACCGAHLFATRLQP